MAKNPMQKKITNAVLVAVLITILITGAIIVCLFLMLNQKNKEEAARLARIKSIYVLGQDVYSGQIITPDMLIKKEVDSLTVPADAITDISEFENAVLEGEAQGNTYRIYQDEDGFYIQPASVKGYLTYHEDRDIYTVKSDGRDIEIKIVTPAVMAKVDLKENTVMTPNLIIKSNEQLTDDQRIQEYNVVILPTNLEPNQYIDIRLMLPNGQDYIVVSKKSVINTTADTIWIKLSEEETITMSNAIVEAFKMTGSKLYATTYVEPGNQTQATPTYPVSREVLDLINSDPNVIQTAKTELWNRYHSNGGETQRNEYINNELEKYTQQGQTNIETKMQEAIRKQQEARQDYLEELEAEDSTVE